MHACQTRLQGFVFFFLLCSCNVGAARRLRLDLDRWLACLACLSTRLKRETEFMPRQAKLQPVDRQANFPAEISAWVAGFQNDISRLGVSIHIAIARAVKKYNLKIKTKWRPSTGM